jgi:hypothetical protein
MFAQQEAGQQVDDEFQLFNALAPAFAKSQRFVGTLRVIEIENRHARIPFLKRHLAKVDSPSSKLVRWIIVKLFTTNIWANNFLVAGVTAFITSANFTESAHERNIELGVLFRDNPRVVESIRLKFESLIQNGFLKPLPAR